MVAATQRFVIADADYVPSLRPGYVLREFESEGIVWGHGAPAPAYLDPVARVVLGIIDGAASIHELVDDVHDVLGVDREIADQQIRRVVTMLGAHGILTDTPEPVVHDDDLDLYVDPPND